jgi:hypothetical protein
VRQIFGVFGAGLAAGFLLAAGLAPAALALPIPNVPIGSPPAFSGHVTIANPVRGIPPTPHNPFMAPNGESEIHDDGWQTDATTWGGPLGRHPQQVSSFISRDCGSITFDRRGRVLSVCVGVTGPELYMFDPRTLATLATFMLPIRQSVPSNLFQDFTGGGYFYLDSLDQVVVSTTTRHIYVIGETAGSPGFTLVHDYDLTSVLKAGESVTSALPDSNGLLWIVTKTDGVVATLNFTTGKVDSVRLGNGADAEIENSFATDQHGGVYIDTNRKLYRFGAGPDGVPRIVWQVTYPNSGVHKPGQVDDGTGTTPTVMDGGYVNITDNADPMDIMVYRTAPHPFRWVRVRVRGHGHRRQRRRRIALPRQVCRVPIFSKGASADENSLIVAGRSMIAENNYGYTDPTSVQGKTTSPGFARVDINRNGRGCHRVWLNTTSVAPTVVSKLALASGLVYSYTLDASGNWYWTALDFRTGRVVYKIYSGSGVGYNNNYAGISISPTGVEYVGALGGVMLLRDG